MHARLLMVLAAAALLCFAISQSRAAPMRTSFYSYQFAGRLTANGERFNPLGFTAAHRTLPFGTRLRVTYGGRSVTVRINDRGPYVAGRQLDLSLGAARVLGMTAAGVVTVEAERVQ